MAKNQIHKPYCILWRIKPELRPVHGEWAILDSFLTPLERDNHLDKLKEHLPTKLEFRAGTAKDLEGLNFRITQPQNT